MKHLFFLLLFIFVTGTSRANDDDIPLTSDDMSALNNKRDEHPTDDSNSSFVAKLAPDKTIFIMSEQTETFEVEVYDSSCRRLLYHGVTINGYYHITSDFTTGAYVLKIKSELITCTGRFEIE